MNDSLLADDHSELDALLGELFAALDAGDIQRAFRKLDFVWARLAMHIRAEHLHLFPAILGALNSENKTSRPRVPTVEIAQNRIEKLRGDHDFFMVELAGAVKQMREICENDSPDRSDRLSAAREKINAVRRRLESHNKMEETEVYRWLGDLLEPSERAALNERMRKEIGNLPPRFGKPGKIF